MATGHTNAPLGVALAFGGVVLAYGMQLYPLPSSSDLSHVVDEELRNAAITLRFRAWAWSLVICLISLTAILMVIKQARGWKPVAIVGAVTVFIFQDFPINIYKTYFYQANSFEQVVQRVSIYAGNPEIFASIVMYGLLAPLLCCAVLYLIIDQHWKRGKN